MSKIIATFVEGKLVSVETLPVGKEEIESGTLPEERSKALLRVLDATEKRVLTNVRDNFDDLRDFIHQAL